MHIETFFNEEVENKKGLQLHKELHISKHDCIILQANYKSLCTSKLPKTSSMYTVINDLD